MKAAVFDLASPRDVAEAVDLLAQSDGTGKIIAGGQSLGPMLNLRFAQPALLIDVRRIEALRAVTASDDGVAFGACVTHAIIEDGLVPDATCGLMQQVAADVAYRAIRNRGTLGGSLCHADPAADWVSVMLLLSATLVIAGPRGVRELAIEDFMASAFSTALEDDEILTAIRVPRLSNDARWSFYKLCRKPGEFAQALACILLDPERARCRAVIGATNGKPHLVADARALLEARDEATLHVHVEAAGYGDGSYEHQVHYVALKRAIARLEAA
jgi:carbon-monoxide dehydrogenase medium subunit